MTLSEKKNYIIDMTREQKLARFLSLADFDEYMDCFEELQGLNMDVATFKKEMQLMETDGKYSHRQKETIRNKRIRSLVTDLHQKIDTLRDEIISGGFWLSVPNQKQQLTVTYRYPNGEKGDIDNEIALRNGAPKQFFDDLYCVSIPFKDLDTIEILCFPSRSYFSRYEYSVPDPASGFLSKYNRMFQIEKMMAQVHYYNEKEYRSLRTVADPVLRKVLQDRYKLIADKRNEIYEDLIQNGSTNARWLSEQKAYAIVRNYFPDAKFHYEADWLRAQHLDIYIPSKKTAIEYQGKQHTESVEFFGGDEGLKNNIIRDQRKRQRCRQNGVTLLYWDYDAPLSDDYFINSIVPNIG